MRLKAESFDLDWPYCQFSPEDTEVLKRLLKKVVFHFGIIVEIGSWVGKSTSVLANFARKNGYHVWAIDNFKGTGSDLSKFVRNHDVKKKLKYNLKHQGLLKYVKIMDMKSIDALDLISNRSIEFLFIDGDHRYSHVKNDIINYWPKMAKNGIMCGHDFEGFDYNREYVNIDFKDGRHHGVISAVQECLPSVQRDGRIWWFRN